MRTAETILNVLRQRGQRGLPLQRIYRLLFNRELYLLAYGRIYRNHGAMTPGSTPETVDGMTLDKIDSIIARLKQERYRWQPVRRVYIEKKHSKKMRPLGLPSWSDKLLQEVLRLLLEAYFEPTFSTYSHGFRPQRGCHTALREIYHKWVGTAWFIEGDIAQCYDTLDHTVLMSILGEHIQDGRILHLLDELLKVGYLEKWKYNATLSGAPQGSGVSPVLSNIYLDKLDKYVEKILLPSYNCGTQRKRNTAYNKLRSSANYLAKHGRRKEAALLRKQSRRLPCLDPQDPDYRRLHYVRYADDTLLGFCGPRQEAETIKQQLRTFLSDELKLQLSTSKTLITQARTQPARFLGYDLQVIQANNRLDHLGRRATNGNIGLKVPAGVVRERRQRYMRAGKPVHRSECLFDTDYSTIEQYQQEFRGIVQYYRLAYNLSSQFSKLKWVMEQSLTKTLAAKYRISVPKVYKRYQTMLNTPTGSYKGLMARVEREGKAALVAQWGGINLKRQLGADLNDKPNHVWNARTELVRRLLANECELCGATENIVVHHIRQLKDLRQKGRGAVPAWAAKMAARRRKTLIVCVGCHQEIHAGRIDGSQETKRRHWKAG